MIEIRSFVQLADNSLVLIELAEPPLPDDSDTEGVFALTVDDTVLMEETLVDDVADFWHYVVHAFERFLDDGRGDCYLPDQPVRFALEQVGVGAVHISVTNIREPRHATVRLTELADALEAAGHHFFREFTRLRPEEAEANREMSEELSALAARARARRLS